MKFINNIFKKKKKLIILILISIAIITLIISFSGNKNKKIETIAKDYTVEIGTIDSTISGKATVQPNDQYTVTSVVSGDVLNTYFEEGDVVKKDEVMYEIDSGDVDKNIESSDLRSIKKRGDESTDLLKTFESDPYNLVNYAQLKFAEKETTFTIYNNVAQNISGNQDTHTITINQGDRTFLQTHSSSAEGAIVNIRSALRFYDEHDETITAYEYNEQEQWTADAEPTKYYTYDEYMLKYGKLNQGLYVIDEDLNFLTTDTTVEEGEWMSGVIIHQITKKSVNL